MPYVKLLTSAVWCRRQPFTSTSVWSGLRPRSVNGRTMSPASVTLCRGKLMDGDTAWRMTLVSVLPCCASCSAGKMSTGTASSSAAVCRAREPTTTSIGASWTVLLASVKSWRAYIPPTPIVTAAAPAW